MADPITPPPPPPPPQPAPEKGFDPNLRRLLRDLKQVGFVLSGIVAVVGAVKATLDVKSAAENDLRHQIEQASDFYLAAAGRVMTFKIQGDAQEARLLGASFQQVLMRPDPNFSEGLFDGPLKTMIARGDRQLCLDRKFSILTHLSVADAATSAELVAARSTTLLHVSQNDPRNPASLVEKEAAALDIKCGGLAGDDGTAAVKTSAQNDKAPAASPAAPSSPSAPQQTIPGLGVKNTLTPDLGAWDIDVLPCSAAQVPRATQVATTLAAMADGRQRLGGEKLGRIRLGPKWGIGTNLNEVLYDPNEENLAIAVVKLATAQTGATFAAQKNAGAATRWYLSVFVCAG